MNELFAALGIKKASIAAGAVGAALAFKFFKGLPWPERVYTALLSLPIALFAAPAAAEVFELGPKAELFLHVILAAVGIAALSAFFYALPEWIAAARRKFLGS